MVLRWLYPYLLHECRSEDQWKRSQRLTLTRMTLAFPCRWPVLASRFPAIDLAFSYRTWPAPLDIRFVANYHVQGGSSKISSQFYVFYFSGESTLTAPSRGHRGRETRFTVVRLRPRTQTTLIIDPSVFSLQGLSTDFDNSSQALEAWASGEDDDLKVRSTAIPSPARSY